MAGIDSAVSAPRRRAGMPRAPPSDPSPAPGYDTIAVHTTRRLLQAVAASPREGFAALHVRHAARLAVWANLHVGPALRRWLSVDDLVQEIWTRAYAGFATFDRQRGDFRAWLFGIAYNVLREQLRALRLRPTEPIAPPGAATAPDPTDGATSVVSALTNRGQHDALAAAIAGLADDERRLVVWRGLEELPYAEIGARLGLTTIAVESRWRRLLERLRQRLPRELWADWLPDDRD